MERKGGSTAVVTAQTVATGLTKTVTTPAEEKALRMRYGAKVDVSAPLPQAHNGNEVMIDELLLIELQLLKAVRAHQAAKAAKLNAPRNMAKDKIVRSLKKKTSR